MAWHNAICVFEYRNLYVLVMPLLVCGVFFFVLCIVYYASCLVSCLVSCALCVVCCVLCCVFCVLCFVLLVVHWVYALLMRCFDV